MRRRGAVVKPGINETTMVNRTLYFLTPALILLLACCTRPDNTQELKTIAERYFRGIYFCDSTVVDELCADDITISYPAFQQLFNTPAIRGRDEVRHFSNHFCSRWTDGRLTLDKTIADSNTVVFMWSFRARYTGPDTSGSKPDGTEESWGGITIISFNADGKIAAEIGEESAPGPFGRMHLH